MKAAFISSIADILESLRKIAPIAIYLYVTNVELSTNVFLFSSAVESVLAAPCCAVRSPHCGLLSV